MSQLHYLEKEKKVKEKEKKKSKISNIMKNNNEKGKSNRTSIETKFDAPIPESNMERLNRNSTMKRPTKK